MKLLNKTLIAVGTISSVIGLTFLGAYAFTKNGEEIRGSKNQTKLNLTDLFSEGKNFVAFVSPNDIETPIGTYDAKNDLISYSNKKFSFGDFFNQFLADHDGTIPVMRISKNGLNFYNEYLEAVPPKDFYEYVDWFIQNVAWGPEALTLKSFSIVRNISRSGNTVTLGGHETKDKETKIIKFYPDSFFGSLPLFDNSSGKSNSPDKLLHSLNSKLASQKEIDEYLANIDRFNIIANDKTLAKDKVSFRNLNFAHLLKGKKVFNFVMPSGQTFFIDAKTKIEAFKKVVEYNQKQANFSNRVTQDITILEESIISQVSLAGTSLQIKFGENGFKQVVIPINDYSQVTQNNLDELEAIMMNTLLNFRDIYNIEQYKKGEYILYDMGVDKLPKIFESKLKAKEDLGADYNDAKQQKVILSDIAVSGQKLKLEFSDFGDKVVKTIELDGTDESQEIFSFFFLLKRAFNYKMEVSPYVVKAEGENLDVKTGKTTKLFKIYNEIYQDLIETVLYKYPYLNRIQEGEHLVRYLDKNGVYRFKMATGQYKGLAISDRIPFLMLLSATSKDYKGVGIDFLKYVGAHEYGHHTTLQNIQNIGDGNIPVLLGSLSGSSTPSDSQYYNANVLREYFKARTKSLDFKQGAINDVEKDGPYVFFKWTDINTGKEIFESKSDIWGSESKDVTKTLNNKRRRFVQDLEGLKETAKQRGISLHELFLMNSLDNNSGTINPQYSGQSQFFNDQRNFETLNYAKLFASLKDGKDNPIKFIDEAFVTLNGQRYPINPIIIEYEKDGETVKEVKMFFANGDPVINVKPGETLNSQQKKLENTIKSTLLGLLYQSFSSSGWDSATTDLVEELAIYANRAAEIGISEGIDKNNKSEAKRINWLKKYFSNRDLEEADNNLTNWQKINKGNVSLYTNIIAQNGLGSEDENRIDLSTQLIDMFAPVARGRRLNGSVLKFSSNQQQYFADYAKIGTQTYPQLPLTPNRAFSTVFATRQNSITNNPRNKFAYRLLDKRDRPMIGISSQNFSTSKGVIGVDPVNVKKNNPPRTASIFEAYKNEMLVNYQTDLDKTDGTVGKQLVKTLGFTSLEDLIEFGSIDLTKVTYGKKMIDGKEKLYRIFDVEYAKTKFDLIKFKTNYSKWVNSLKDSNAANKALLLSKVATEQDIANEVMERFLLNSLQFMVKNTKISENLENAEVAISEELGIGSFSQKSFVLNSKPNRNNKEMNIQDLSEAIKKFIKINNIVINNGQDKTNHQLTAYDLFILMGQIRWNFKIPESKEKYDNGPVLYTDILHMHFKRFGASQDVINYINSPIETNLSGIFSDYTNTISELLTRDFVQITYSSGKEDFRTLPSYLKGANESNTGFEYFLPASDTAIWQQSMNSMGNLANIVSSVLTNFSSEQTERRLSDFRQNVVDKDATVIFLRKEIKKLENEKLTYLNDLRTKNLEAISSLATKEAGIRQANASIASLNVLINELEYVEHNGKQVLKAIVNNKAQILSYKTTGIPGLDKEIADVNAEIKKIAQEKTDLQQFIADSNSTTPGIQEAKIKVEIINSLLTNLEAQVSSISYRKRSLDVNINLLEESLKFFEALTPERVKISKDDYKALISREQSKIREFNVGLEELKNKSKEIAELGSKHETEINSKISNNNKEIENQIKKITNSLPMEEKFEKNTLASSSNYDNTWRFIRSNYFGMLNQLNNGYFYDRWLRKELNWGIYDDKGKSIQDDSIRITDLNGDKVTDVARAMWVYLLKSKGVSLGTLTGNWRDKERDANVFWGYVPNEIGKKIKYLVFEDTETKAKTYLDIKKENTNNLHYYKKAGDEATKVTLADEGYTSWTTNYAFVAKYQNSLLKPGNTYKVYFANEDQILVEGLNLIKDTKLLGENNKTVSQSPTYFYKKDGNENDIYYFVQDQFNV